MGQEWDKKKADMFVAMADVIVPERRTQFAMIADLLPFNGTDRFSFIDMGCGEGLLSKTILEQYAHCVGHATDVAEKMIAEAKALLASYGQRAFVWRHNLHEPDYLDRVVPGPVGVVTSSLAIHHCDDAEKASLYRSAFAKLTSPGAMIIIDVTKPASAWGTAVNKKYWQEYIRQQVRELTASEEQYEKFKNVPVMFYDQPAAEDQPATLLDNLRMLTDAGFKHVDCFWKKGPFTIFGGYK